MTRSTNIAPLLLFLLCLLRLSELLASLIQGLSSLAGSVKNTQFGSQLLENQKGDREDFEVF